MKKLLLPGLLLGGFVAYLMAKKRALQNLLLNVLDIAINSKKTNIRQVVFNVKFSAENRENIGVTINKINLRLFANNVPVADFNRTVLIQVGPNETKELNAEIIIGNLSLVTSLIQILTSGNAPVMEVRGNVVTDLGTITVNS